MKCYEVGEIVIVEVTNIEKYGIFVKVDGTYKGLIHISQISDKFVSNILDYVNINDKIRSRILLVGDNKKMSLSIKNLDYKIIKNREKVEEYGSGFSSLKDNLDIWILKKIKEIEKKR